MTTQPPTRQQLATLRGVVATGALVFNGDARALLAEIDRLEAQQKARVEHLTGVIADLRAELAQVETERDNYQHAAYGEGR